MDVSEREVFCDSCGYRFSSFHPNFETSSCGEEEGILGIREAALRVLGMISSVNRTVTIDHAKYKKCGQHFFVILGVY